jgi:hypothetical protein
MTSTDQPVYVNEGDFFEITLPWSEVCMHLRVHDTRMTAQLLATAMPMVQLWKDGHRFSMAITTGEAGLFRDPVDDRFYGYGITDVRDRPNMPRECEYKRVHGDHAFTIMISIPVKSTGAVTGYSDYRECSECGTRVPASSVTVTA